MWCDTDSTYTGDIMEIGPDAVKLIGFGLLIVLGLGAMALVKRFTKKK